MIPTRPFLRGATLAALAVLLTAGALPAQTLIAPEEDLDFDRPEAWAMKWFGSLIVMTGLGGPPELPPGGWELAFEGGWIPQLSEEERRVGFIGTKEEDLNRSSVFGRLRLSAGLPGRFVLTAGYVPPVELDGATPHLLALSLGRPLVERRSFRLDARLTAQRGTFEGDFTCPEDVVRAGDDPEVNPLNCLEPSDDEMTVRTAGLELSGTWTLAGAPRWSPTPASPATGSTTSSRSGPATARSSTAPSCCRTGPPSPPPPGSATRPASARASPRSSSTAPSTWSGTRTGAARTTPCSTPGCSWATGCGRKAG